MEAAREAGLVANIVRFSNVFGCRHDHAGRVVMAFAKAAARGGVISVEGGANTFDFTAVEDAVDGLWRLIQATARGENLPPVQFVTGKGTTLRDLAEIAASRALCPVNIVEAAPRNFDVTTFVGDPSRAYEMFGWRAQAQLGDRIALLIADLARPDAEPDGGRTSPATGA